MGLSRFIVQTEANHPIPSKNWSRRSFSGSKPLLVKYIYNIRIDFIINQHFFIDRANAPAYNYSDQPIPEELPDLKGREEIYRSIRPGLGTRAFQILYPKTLPKQNRQIFHNLWKGGGSY